MHKKRFKFLFAFLHTTIKCLLYSSFCLVDKAGTCCSITVYNIIPGYGVKIGDSVAIAEPLLKNVDFTYKNKVQLIASFLTALTKDHLVEKLSYYCRREFTVIS